MHWSLKPGVHLASGTTRIVLPTRLWCLCLIPGKCSAVIRPMTIFTVLPIIQVVPGLLIRIYHSPMLHVYLMYGILWATIPGPWFLPQGILLQTPPSRVVLPVML